jgi:Radical SAM superfamily
MKFDVILFTDTVEFHLKSRGYGAHRLATHLRNNGYTCLVVDYSCIVSWNTYTAILDAAIGPNTLAVGFSTTWMPFKFNGEVRTRNPGEGVGDDGHRLSLQTLTASFGKGEYKRWIDYVKMCNHKTKTIIGGARIDFYLDAPVDYAIVGIGETETLDLLDSLSGKTKRIFNRIIDHDRKAHNNCWDFRDSSTSYTDYDFILANETLNLEISRGCKFKCAYCSYPLIGQKTQNYLKHPDVIRKELIENYERWGTTKYFIVDDTFNDSTEKMRMMTDISQSLPFELKFWCYLRADLVAAHPEQIQLLKDMGIQECYFGIETFNPDTAKFIGKGMARDRIIDTLYQCKEVWGADSYIAAGIVVGLPHETRKSIQTAVDFFHRKDCPVDLPNTFPLSIIGNHDVMKYMYMSELDRNYQKYGYYFPNPETNLYKWAKDDDTDINSYDQAVEICDSINKTLTRKLYKGDFYVSSFNDERFKDRDKTLRMSDIEYKELIEGTDFINLFKTTSTRDYLGPLINKLKNDDTSNTN